MKKSEVLRSTLKQIDHKQYPNYKRLKGSYDFGNYVLSIDHVQGDPFAAPSKISIHLSGTQAGFPPQLYLLKQQKIAIEDQLLRTMCTNLKDISFKARGSGKSGIFSVSEPGQEVLERSSSYIDPTNGNISVYLEAGFPANGRTINSRELDFMLFELLPEAVTKSLFYSSYDPQLLQSRADLAEDQLFLRQTIKEMNLVAFIADGSILPRQSGISDKPMDSPQCIKFESPPTTAVEVNLPHHGVIRGMGIKRGVTLIVGGGYHGKSTLLEALELGVYDHIAGDGREFVITDNSAVKIRAEDGRFVKDVDISIFINDLPNGKDTKRFNSLDASGSTSQATNVVEAMESGSNLLLIDEDTSATNFMVRDELMERVVSRSQEPITPYIHRVRQLYESFGISSIIVAGSSGCFFHVADTIIQMRQYSPIEITELAKEEAKKFPLSGEVPPEISPSFDRIFTKYGQIYENGRFKTKVMGSNLISLNHEEIDMKYVEQLVDKEQSLMLVLLLKYAELYLIDGKKTLIDVVDQLEKKMNDEGFNWVYDDFNRDSRLAKPRRYEIFAIFNRFRKL